MHSRKRTDRVDDIPYLEQNEDVEYHPRKDINHEDKIAEDLHSRKKYKSDGDDEISKVLMIKGVPVNFIEQDLKELLGGFGNVSQTLIISQKRLAFAEMENVESACSVIKHFKSNPLYIRRERIYMQFSKRKEIKPNSRYPSRHIPPRHIPPRHIPLDHTAVVGSNYIPFKGNDPLLFRGRDPNTFSSSNYMTIGDGNHMKIEGGNHMKIEEGDHMKFEDVDHMAIGGEILSIGGSDHMAARNNYLLERGYDGQLSNSRSKPLDSDANTILLVAIKNQRLPVTIENLYTIFSSFGKVLRIVVFEKKTLQVLVEYPNLKSAADAKDSLQDKDMFQDCNTLFVQYSRMKPPLKVVANNHRARDFTQNAALDSSRIFPQPNFPLHQQAGIVQQQPGFPPALPYMTPPIGMADNMHSPQMYSMAAHGPVVLVHNLNEEKVTPDVLFTLFGVYGDVIRVKILYKKRDTALVEFASTPHAARARQFLDKSILYGNEMKIIPSKHGAVKLPTPIVEDLAKDYSNSRLHRFKRQNSRNEKHISPPSPTLHLSGLPENILDEELNDIFNGEAGALIHMKLFGNGNRKMALLTFDSTEVATYYLIRYHNHTLQGKPIKINFSSDQRKNERFRKMRNEMSEIL